MNRAPFREPGALALAPQAWGHDFEFGGRAEQPFTTEGAAAVVEIKGPLVQASRYCWWLSYEAIRGMAAAAFESSQRVVVLRIDSPGGDVKGCFELARELRAMAIAKGKPLIAYVDGVAASAAYALACAAERIVLPATAFVGSIGVIEALCDQTKLDEQLGLRFAIIASGERKADGNPHVPLSKSTTTAMQGHVDGLAELFFGLVEELRGIPADKTRAMEAALFLGANGVTAGLADAVQTWPNLIASLEADDSNKKEGAGPMPKYLEDAKKALQKAAEEGTDEEKATAKKMLAAADGDEPPPSEKEEKKEEGKKAEDETPADDDKKAKAEADDEEKKDAEARSRASGAQAAGGVDVVGMARRIHALEAERAAEKDKTERDALLAKRPDFSAEVQATLRGAPIETLRAAVETWPRIAGGGGGGGNGRPYSPALAAQVAGTRGASQTGNGDDGPPTVPQDEANFIDRVMGFGARHGEIRRDRNKLELGAMSPAEARAKLAELEKAGKQ